VQQKLVFQGQIVLEEMPWPGLENNKWNTLQRFLVATLCLCIDHCKNSCTLTTFKRSSELKNKQLIAKLLTQGYSLSFLLIKRQFGFPLVEILTTTGWQFITVIILVCQENLELLGQET
jgi:hypothetical protein